MIVGDVSLLQEMQDQAGQALDQSIRQLTTVHESLAERTEGRSQGRLIGSFLLSLCWGLLFTVLYFVCRDSRAVYYAGELFYRLSLGAVLVSLGLVVFMILDELVQLHYYGSLLGYAARLQQLRQGLEKCRAELGTRRRELEQREAQGWREQLAPAAPIMAEANAITARTQGMQKLSTGFFRAMKNIIFFAGGALWSATLSLALLPMIYELLDEDVSMGWFYAAVAAAVVGQIILARLVWGACDCEVTNLTLLIQLAGPVIFAALIALGALVVVLVKLLLYIIGIIVVIGILIGLVSGG